MRVFAWKPAENSRNPLENMVVVSLDTSSISTFSAILETAKFGKNKEGDLMAQVNLLLICNAVTGMPLIVPYYKEGFDVILDNENYYESIGMHTWSKTISIDAPRRGRGSNSHDLTCEKVLPLVRNRDYIEKDYECYKPKSQP